MTAKIDVQRVARTTQAPTDAELAHACATALGYCSADGTLSVRLTERDEMQTLNQRFRDKPSATNVLSFPADVDDEEGVRLLGDIILCAPVIEDEALEQGKSAAAHYLHMVVHGTLHLLGYDHIDDDDARIMEQCEREVLAHLGIDDPYVPRVSATGSVSDGHRTPLNG